MPDFKNGRIYKIISDQTDRVYIGSTTNPLSHRMAQHRRAHRVYDGTGPKTTSFEILQYEDAQIVLIEDFACDRREQLRARERHWIENTANCVNKLLPGRTLAEFRQVHREEINAKCREYREANRDAVNAKAKEYREANREKMQEKHMCECGGRYTAVNKSIHIKTKKHSAWVAKNAAPVDTEAVVA